MRSLSWLLPLLVLSVTGCSRKESGTSSEKVAADPVITESLTRGEIIYKQTCIACHMADGLGAPPMNPTLARTSFVLGDKKALISIVLKGMTNQSIEGKNYHNVMPPLDFLTDEQIADVLSYVRNNFGNKESIVASEEVKALRQKYPK